MNMENVSLHMHLFYEDMGAYLLDRVSKVWDGRIHLSLVRGRAGDSLLNIAQKMFDLEVTFIENKGNDQYGFFKSFVKNTDKSEYVLYLHDKKKTEQEWLDQISDIFLDRDKLKGCIDMLQQEKVGMVSSSLRHGGMHTLKQIYDYYYKFPFQHRAFIVRMVQTHIWTRELQSILDKRYNLAIPELDELKSDEARGPESYECVQFTEGNVFLCRREVVEYAHKCVHESFFEGIYRADGGVEHGMERFYPYVSKCLGLENLFVK